jgi:hypothetical protein
MMSQSQISRRQLLKILAAGAGTAVLSSVPNKWETPVIDVGMLPAHAQGLSGFGAISGTVTGPPVASPVRGEKSSAPSNGCSTDATVLVVGPGSYACVNFGKIYKIYNVPPGTYTVQASSYIGCSAPSHTNVVVLAGQTTENIDFDFVCN